MDNSRLFQEASKRLFIGIGIPVSKGLLKLFNSIQNELKQSQIKWTKPENLHITLQFLGNIPIQKINALNKAVSISIINNSPFLLELQSIGTFGKNAPKVLWAGIKENYNLLDIYSKINIGLDSVGFNFNKAMYHPHLTLGRIKHIHSLAVLQEISNKSSNLVIQEYTISEISLFVSKLGNKGPNYTVIQSYKLA